MNSVAISVVDTGDITACIWKIHSRNGKKAVRMKHPSIHFDKIMKKIEIIARWNRHDQPDTRLRSSPRVNPNTNRRYSTPASTEWSWSIDWRSAAAWLLQSCLESMRRLAGQRGETVHRLRRCQTSLCFICPCLPNISVSLFLTMISVFPPSPLASRHPLWPEGRSPKVRREWNG